MAVSHALRRVLRIRELEEEQSRRALESAIGELIRLKNALTAATERGRCGRRLVAASVQSGELPDRLAGLDEIRAALRHTSVLSDRIESVHDEVEALRRGFLGRRVERRQVETLIQETEARDSADAGRRNQQLLDDGHRARMFRAQASEQRAMKATGFSAGEQIDATESESDEAKL